jgi:unsaturated rhamnogalacturonyl hydrolase
MSAVSAFTRRSVILGGIGALAAVPAMTADAAPPADWSRAVVDSTMKRWDPFWLGGWDYTRGLYLYGQYLVYKRTGEAKYLTYIKAWMDKFVASDGGVGNSYDDLDSMRPAQLLPLLYTETGDVRYKIAAGKVRARFATYPRTSDGGMFHATSKVGQLWADGVFMAQPFLALYGRTFGDEEYCYEEAARNMVVYFEHLNAGNGLLYHGYDEDGSESWAKGPGHHSTVHWARAIGWFGMAAIDLLEILPAGHPRRAALIDIVRYLAGGYARYQDPATGRWFQVVDHGTDAGNWTETSASAMYTFMLSHGVQRGYLEPSYQQVADKGYQGVLAKVSVGADGLTDVRDICIGTDVGGDLNYYYGRWRFTNDLHGLGAFVIMNEQLR